MRIEVCYVDAAGCLRRAIIPLDNQLELEPFQGPVTNTKLTFQTGEGTKTIPLEAVVGIYMEE